MDKGRFHVYGIGHIHEAIELLTGRSADDVFGEAAATLERFRAISRER